jgi:hypothetical protein
MRWAQGFALLVSGFALSLGVQAKAQTPPQQQPVAPPTSASSVLPAGSQRPATPPQGPSCFPACRTGYTCFNGACVSLCNPPCAQGESCTAAGECALQQPALAVPAPQPAPPGAAYQQPYPADPYPASPSPDANDAGSASTLGWLRRGPVFIARLGLSHLGNGTATEKSTARISQNGFSQEESTTDEGDYAERSPIMLGFDALFHATAGLRLGASAWLVPFVSIEGEGATDATSLGQEATFFAALEGVIPTGALAIVLRAQLGPSVLFVGGDLGENNDGFLAACDQIVVEKCTVELGPHVGLSYGPLFGLVGGSQQVRWRFDVAAQLYSSTLGDRELEGEGPFGEPVSASTETDVSGARFWLMGGVEF